MEVCYDISVKDLSTASVDFTIGFKHIFVYWVATNPSFPAAKTNDLDTNYSGRYQHDNVNQAILWTASVFGHCPS